MTRYVGIVYYFKKDTQGKFSIEANFGVQEKVRIELCNSFGKVVKILENKELSGAYVREINITDLPEGIYYLRVKTADGNSIETVIRN